VVARTSGAARSALCALTVLLPFTLSPAVQVASGSTVSVSAGVLTYAAAPGETNSLTATLNTPNYRLADSGAPITPGSGCTAVDVNTVDCAGVTSVDVMLDDMNDTASVTLGVPATLHGGTGDDTLTGHSEDDVLIGDGGDDVLSGAAGHDLLDGGTGADVLSGGADHDTATYASRSGDVTVDIDNVANDGESGEHDNVQSDVQDVIGGAGNDLLIGSLGDNVLSGNGGEDTFVGQPGSDTFHGGAGTDTVSYADRTGPVSAGIDGVADDGELGEGDNVQPDVENLFGGSGADTLSGGPGPNAISGGDGGDILDGGLGADELNGGDGTDTVSYATRSAAVVVDLDGLADDGEPGENDAVGLDVETVIGGEGGDTLIGNAFANSLLGGSGDDTIQGEEGSDVLSGDAGADTIFSRDSVDDSVLCGSEVDSVVSDSLDFVDADCEQVDRGTTGGGGTETGGGTGTGGGSETGGENEATVVILQKTVKMTRAGRIRIPVRCDGPDVCNGTLAVDSAHKIRVAGERKPRRVHLRTRSFSWPTGLRTKITVRIPRKVREVLRRKGGLDIRVTVHMHHHVGTRALEELPQIVIIRANPATI
jgi:Ca2+-binding RTX toxin-like protein